MSVLTGMFAKLNRIDFHCFDIYKWLNENEQEIDKTIDSLKNLSEEAFSFLIDMMWSCDEYENVFYSENFKEYEVRTEKIKSSNKQFIKVLKWLQSFDSDSLIRQKFIALNKITEEKLKKLLRFYEFFQKPILNKLKKKNGEKYS